MTRWRADSAGGHRAIQRRVAVGCTSDRRGAARAAPDAVVVCAAGGLPGELHKLWQARRPGTYHLEYGYSCMGYEIAGGLGVKLAEPEREVIVMVGDGSYLMMNSEIATSVMMGLKLTIVLLDNGGFGCIDRLQRATGGAVVQQPVRKLRRHRARYRFRARTPPAWARSPRTCSGLAELEDGRAPRANRCRRTSVIVMRTDPRISTAAGGHWWDVARAGGVNPNGGAGGARGVRGATGRTITGE